jgi:hypothetical protein
MVESWSASTDISTSTSYLRADTITGLAAGDHAIRRTLLQSGLMYLASDRMIADIHA